MNESQLQHHFCGGVYAKVARIPADTAERQHAHSYDHLSFLMAGSVALVVDGVSTHHTAPAVMTIKAGKQHTVVALTDVTWACVHATNETDPEKVDQAILGS